MWSGNCSCSKLNVRKTELDCEEKIDIWFSQLWSVIFSIIFKNNSVTTLVVCLHFSVGHLLLMNYIFLVLFSLSGFLYLTHEH